MKRGRGRRGGEDEEENRKGKGRGGEEQRKGRGEEDEEMVTILLNGHPTARTWLGIGLDELLTGMHTPEVLCFNLQMRGISTLSNLQNKIQGMIDQDIRLISVLDKFSKMETVLQ